jgi:autotransporter-associated beta strand protein/T5SS/PEP-CTERM-associated repeat protein
MPFQKTILRLMAIEMPRARLATKRWFIVFVMLACGAPCCEKLAHAQLTSGTNWSLTFADEFNGTTLDKMKWSNGHPWDTTSSKASNIAVGGGVLNLNSVREPYNGGQFSGVGVATRPPSGSDLFDMTYGYVEASMKMPSLPGSWPAFWMLENGWPPELDINEYPIFVNGTWSAYNYSDNIHYTNSSGGNSSLGNGVHYAGRGDLTAGFHTYGMGWTPTSVIFYIDGTAQSTITDPTAVANLLANGPMYIMMDNSGGGSWPGVPSDSQWASGATSDLQVQWIRVWKDTGGSATSISWSNTAANGSGSWTSGSMWSGGAVPQLSSQTAVFGANSVNNQTVTWNNSETIGGMTFNSTTSYTIGSVAGSLMLASGSLTSNTVLIDATSASGSGANYLNSRLELWSNATMQSSSKPLIVGGNIIGAGGLTIAAGAVSLTNSSSYTGGTTLNGGTLTATSNAALGSGAVQFNTGGNNYAATLALAGGIELDNPITLTARSNSTTAIDNSNANNTLGGQISLQVGGSNYAILSDAGQLTLSGAASGGTAIAVASGVSGTRTISFQGAGNTLVSGAMLNGNAGSLAVAVNGPGALILSSSNGFSGGTTISGGALIAHNAGALGSGNVTMAANSDLNFAAATNAPLAIGGTLGITGGTSTVLGGSIGTSTTSAEIKVTGIASAAAAPVLVNVYGVNGFAPAASDTYTLLHAAAGSSLNAATYSLNLVYNNSNFTVGTPTATATDLTVPVTLAAPLTTAYWIGGLAGAPQVWAASDGSANSNWAATSGGTVQALVPGSSTDVFFNGVGYAASPNGATLGADMTLRSLTISDTSNAVVINPDGFNLTVGSAGILVNSGGTLSMIADNAGGPLTVNGLAQLGGTSTIGGLSGSGTVSATSQGLALVINQTADGTFTGKLLNGANALSLTKQGSAALALSGSNNFSGGTTLAAGKLNVNNAGALSSGGISINGGTLGNTSGATITTSVATQSTWNGDFAFAGPNNLSLNGGTATVAGSSRSLAVSAGVFTIGTLAGSGAFTLTGGGTLALTNANCGPLTDNGLLQIAGTGLFTGLSGSGTLQSSAATALLELDQQSNTTYSGVLRNGTNTLSLVKYGPATVTLSNSSSYTGTTTIYSGALTLVGSNTGLGQITVGANQGETAVLNLIPGSTLTTTGELWVSSTTGAIATMNMTGGTAKIGSWLAVGRGGDSGTLNVSGGSLNIATNNLTIASFAGNHGQVNVSGGTVNAVNSVYVGESGSGAMTLTGGLATATSVIVGKNGGSYGTLNLQPGGLLKTPSLTAGSGTAAFNFSGGTLQNPPLNNLSVAMAVNLTGPATVAVDSGQTGTFTSMAVLGGNGSLTKVGSGLLVLAANDSYTGATTVTAGSLNLTGSNSGLGQITVGSISGQSAVLDVLPGAALNTTGELWLSSVAGAAGVMNMSGGTTNIGSWLAVGRGGNAGTLNMSGGSLNVATNNLTIASFTGNQGQVNVTGGMVNSANSIYVGEGGNGTMTVSGSGVVTASNVDIGLNSGSGGTLNLQSGGLLRTPNIAAGNGMAAFNWSGGTLQNAPSANLSVTMPVNLSGPGTVVIGSGQSGSFNSLAAISGSGSLYLSGGGTLTLSGTNTYTGGTDVLGGQLIVTSPQGIEDGTNLFVGAAGTIFGPIIPAPPVLASAAADAATVPEPGTWMLLAAGIYCAAGIRLRKYIHSRQNRLGGRSSTMCGAVNGSPGRRPSDCRPGCR